MPLSQTSTAASAVAAYSPAGMTSAGYWHSRCAAADAGRHNNVYVDGVFDLFHAGHIAFLKKAKAVGGTGAKLIVGVVTDKDASWKRDPYVSHENRVAMLKHCNIVDEVIETPPLIISEPFLRDREIDFVVHGDDDRQEQFFAVPIALGVMRYVSYTGGISTTEIARRVIQSGTAEKK